MYWEIIGFLGKGNLFPFPALKTKFNMEFNKRGSSIIIITICYYLLLLINLRVLSAVTTDLVIQTETKLHFEQLKNNIIITL